MSTALAEHARKYALAAVEQDRNKDYENAMRNYEAAIQLLQKLITLYPDHPLRPIYEDYIRKYKIRVEQIKRMRVPQAAGFKPDFEITEDTGYSEPDSEGSSSPDEPPPFVRRERFNVSFSDIAGLQQAKEAIKEAIIYPIRRPDLFPLGWPRGILLFGPPGTGKTMLAAAVSNEIDAEFLYVDASSIMSKWLGEGEKNVRRLFDYARSKAEKGTPVIIFIDEIDALLGMHNNEVGGEVRVRNQFLKEMDGIQDKDKNLHVYVIGATNKPWKLDEPFIRRFQKRIYVPLPDMETRREILRLYTRKLRLDNVNLDKLAEMMEGYTGSDIRDIVNAAYMRTIKEYFENGEKGMPRPLSMDDFIEVMKKRKPSVNKSMLKLYDKWFDEFKAL
ncbi:MAG: AAA family ATPase [Desulfurococcales archaeon]|nr:AAA family ATPase [Desulfurococcales archaeon]